MAHSSSPAVYADGFFTDAQLVQLRAEPDLVVEELDDAPPVDGNAQRDPKVEAPAALERAHVHEGAHDDTALDLAKEAMTAEGAPTADAAKSNTGDEGQPAVAEPDAQAPAPAAASASSASAADANADANAAAKSDPKVEKPANRGNANTRRNR